MADNEVRTVFTAEVNGYIKGVRQASQSTQFLSKQMSNLRKMGGINLTFDQQQLKQLRTNVEGARKQVQGLTNDSPALRYALYDVSNTARRAALALGALVALPVGFAIKYEREFANVIRTNELAGESSRDVREQLLSDLTDIAQASPVSWEDITNIAALAGQLGVAQEVIAQFTETVAKFSATTDLTVDAAATAFGRLDQLVEGVDGQFENLGSAILAVGVDSVATESQIVNVSTQIASMGNLAGLSAADIVGLSGALASLGIRPELARGTITRLFSRIGQAAAVGGEELAEFGRITGRSAEEFADAWANRPTEVLQDFFQGINEEGSEAERTLRSLGITSVRDIPAILRLAQSSDEVRRLIELSNDSFLEGTKIQEQYSIISSTLAEQIKRLGQNFQTLGANALDAVGPISFLVGVTNAVVEALTDFSQTELGGTLNNILAVIVLVGAAFATYIAITATLAASLIAASFAAKQLGGSFAFLSPKVLFGGAAFKGLAASINLSTAAAARLSLAMRALGIIGVVVTAIAAVVTVMSLFNKEVKEAGEVAKEYYGDLTRFEEALKKDTKAFDEGAGAIKTFTSAVADDTKERRSNAQIANESLGAIEDEKDALDDATKARQANTIAIGENFEARLRESLVGDPAISAAFSDEDFLLAIEQFGGSGEELIRQIALGTGEAYINGIIEQIKSRRSDLANAIGDGFAGTEELGFAPGAEGFAAARAELELVNNALDSVTDEFNTAIAAANDIVPALERDADAFANLGGEAEDASKKTNLLSDSINDILRDLFFQANYTKDVEDALSDYASALAETGDEANSASGPIQDVIDTIISGAEAGDVNIILGNLSALLSVLQAQGPSTAAAQALVEDAIFRVGSEAGISSDEVLELAAAQALLVGIDPAALMASFSAGLQDVTKSAGGASSKVETLAEKFDKLVDSMFDAINLGRDTENAIFALGEAFGETGDEALYASDEMQDAISSILAQSGSAEEGVASLASLFSNLARTVGGETSPSLQILRQAISQVGAQFGLTEAQVQRFIDTAGDGLADINFDNFNRGIENAQQEVRTLIDFASDLSSVFTRAFDIRFARTSAIDDIADSWSSLSEQVEDARFQLEELQESQSNLGADRGLKEYFLSVAEAYGDTLRAAQLRREIAKLDREQAENTRQIQEAQQIAGGDLTTQGPGARQNRQALLGLLGNYQDYSTALAESGATQEELTEATERARREFTEQARELGFQEADILQYAAAFDDVKVAIENVPRNITVEANVNPALQALNELNASLNKQIQVANDLNRALNQPVPNRSGSGNNLSADVDVAGLRAQISSLDSRISALGAQRNSLRLALARAATSQARSTISRDIGIVGENISALFRQKSALEASLRAGGFAGGGFTGRGGKFEPAGVVHRGEYVIPKQFVNQSSGMPDPSFLAQMQSGMRNYFAGGFVGGGGMGNDGTMMVELSPFDRKLLADAGNVQLRLNGRVVAEATNSNNFSQAQRGTN